jgi:hypothetical protein
VRVTVPPERGKANAAVEQLLAAAVGIPRANAHVVSGHTASRKLLELEGISESELLAKLPKGAA